MVRHVDDRKKCRVAHVALLFLSITFRDDCFCNSVRDVPESAIKPAPLGKIARDFRPGLGVFKGVPVGSRPGGK